MKTCTMCGSTIFSSANECPNCHFKPCADSGTDSNVTCKMCGRVMPAGASECPSCHFKLSAERNMSFVAKGIKVYFIVIIVIILLIFCFTIYQFASIGSRFSRLNDDYGSNPNSTEADTHIDAEEYIKNIELLDAEITEDGFYYVEGTIKNNNNEDLGFVKITFTLYDENGSLLDARSETATLIEANGTWRFKVNCGFAEPSSFKLKSIELL